MIHANIAQIRWFLNLARSMSDADLDRTLERVMASHLAVMPDD